MIAKKSLNLDTHELAKLCTERTTHLFHHYLEKIPAQVLRLSIKHSLLSGGKLLRPLLIYATGHIFDAPLAHCDIPAAAVEMIHTYSLIHDDLPAMDNADLRRGKATCHKIYGDGMAVLAGDALHTLAIEIIATHQAPTLAPERRLEMINVLTHACGPYGMAAGQALDMTIMGKHKITEATLLEVYRLKTGALFSACIELGRLCSADREPKNKAALKEFGDCIGLAFQIQDDILDIEANAETLGKRPGIDVANSKLTYPRMHNLNIAKATVKSLYEMGLQAISHLGPNTYLLAGLAQQMLQRNK